MRLHTLGCALAVTCGASTALSAQTKITEAFIGPTKTVGIAAADFQPALPAVDGPFECAKPERIAPNLVIYIGHFPTNQDYRAAVVVTTDAYGLMSRSGERRGPPIRPITRPDMTSEEKGTALVAATNAVRSTTISLDWLTNRGGVRNHGGGIPDTSATDSVATIERLEQLGRPGDRARRVFAECQRQYPAIPPQKPSSR